MPNKCEVKDYHYICRWQSICKGLPCANGEGAIRQSGGNFHCPQRHIIPRNKALGHTVCPEEAPDKFFF